MLVTVHLFVTVNITQANRGTSRRGYTQKILITNMSILEVGQFINIAIFHKYALLHFFVTSIKSYSYLSWLFCSYMV